MRRCLSVSGADVFDKLSREKMQHYNSQAFTYWKRSFSNKTDSGDSSDEHILHSHLNDLELKRSSVVHLFPKSSQGVDLLSDTASVSTTLWKLKFSKMNTISVITQVFWTPDLSEGVLCNLFPTVVRPSVGPSLNIPEIIH